MVTGYAVEEKNVSSAAFLRQSWRVLLNIITRPENVTRDQYTRSYHLVYECPVPRKATRNRRSAESHATAIVSAYSRLFRPHVPLPKGDGDIQA